MGKVIAGSTPSFRGAVKSLCLGDLGGRTERGTPFVAWASRRGPAAVESDTLRVPCLAPTIRLDDVAAALLANGWEWGLDCVSGLVSCFAFSVVSMPVFAGIECKRGAYIKTRGGLGKVQRRHRREPAPHEEGRLEIFFDLGALGEALLGFQLRDYVQLDRNIATQAPAAAERFAIAAIERGYYRGGGGSQSLASISLRRCSRMGSEEESVIPSSSRARSLGRHESAFWRHAGLLPTLRRRDGPKERRSLAARRSRRCRRRVGILAFCPSQSVSDERSSRLHAAVEAGNREVPQREFPEQQLRAHAGCPL